MWYKESRSMTKQIEKRSNEGKKKKKDTYTHHTRTGSVGRQIRLCLSLFDKDRQRSDSTDLC